MARKKGEFYQSPSKPAVGIVRVLEGGLRSIGRALVVQDGLDGLASLPLDALGVYLAGCRLGLAADREGGKEEVVNGGGVEMDGFGAE